MDTIAMRDNDKIIIKNINENIYSQKCFVRIFLVLLDMYMTMKHMRGEAFV